MLFLSCFLKIRNINNFYKNWTDLKIQNAQIKIIDVISDSQKIAEFNNIKILINDKSIKADYGDIFTGNLYFNRLNFVSNFFSFDYNKYLNSKGVFVSAELKNPLYIKNIKSLRFKIIDKFLSNSDKNKYNSEVSNFLCGLFFNYRTSKKNFYALFRELNISHFLAFSGMHLTIFIYFSNFIPKKFFILKKLVSTLIIITAVFISGGSPSVLRAAFFLIFIYIANLSGRNPYVLETTSLFAIFYILINPWIIFNTSFLLSIVFFSQLLIIRNIIKTCLIFFIENIIFFNTVSIFSPFLNLLLTFIFPFIMITGIIGVVFNGKIAVYSFKIIELFLNFLKFFETKNVIFTLSYAGLIFCIIIIILFYTKRKNFCFFTIFIFITVYIYFSFFPYILLFDTGHGQAVLVNTVFKGGFLFDSGNTHYLSHVSIEKFLNMFNLKIFSHFISHFDYDHYSATEYLVNQNLIKTVFIPEKHNKFKSKNYILQKNNYYHTSHGFFDFYLQRSGTGNKNENSFRYFFSFNNKWFGIFSDQSAQTIELTKCNLPEKLDYYIVSHHGGKNSLNSFIMEKYKNSFFIISCGKSFSHPSKQTLDFLKNKNTHITKNDGALFIDLLTGIKIQLKKQ